MNSSRPKTTLQGYLERVTYYNKDSHYTVARLKTDKTHTPFTVVGYMAGVNPGEALKITGTWETHPRYGQQFKVDFFEVTLPVTVEGIRKYLESGIIKGIGKKMADKIVRCFQEKTLEIIEKNPDKLLEIQGVGKTKAIRITNAWNEHHALRNLMRFLQEMGVETSYGAKIFKKYGKDAVSILRQDPYCLAQDLPGVGFIVADMIARKSGLPEDHPQRIQSCLLYLIQHFIDEGHVFAYQDQIMQRGFDLFQIESIPGEEALDALADSGKIIMESVAENSDKAAVYLKNLYEAESGIANRLKALLSVPVMLGDIDLEPVFEKVQKKLAIALSSEQLAVLEGMLSHRVVIITGGPGTGKTTLIRSITVLFEALGEQIFLAAPTGRAARRISEVTRRKASTIHKLLEYNLKDGRFDKNQDNPLEAHAVIIDEASMVDTFLMYHLMKAVSMNSGLILVGDVFQLPSVGPGNVLSDLIQSKQIKTFELTKIFRQARESPIIVNAHKVRRGEQLDLKKNDDPENPAEFHFIQQENPDRVVAMIVELCLERIPRRFELDPMKEIQVLTPMHRGVTGTINLNRVLQKNLNKNPVMIEALGNTFKSGDKVMHLKNNYQKEVFNGDIGTINSIERTKNRLSVDYYGRNVDYDFEELEELSLAYAISVHKSQGSEYPAVIVPIMTQHFILLQRNLLYTALTRGKKLVILIGTKKALDIARNNDKPGNRLSNLTNRLME